jgi:hypothetical protein
LTNGTHEIKKLLYYKRSGLYFANYISEKGLITRLYRELKKLNSPQINDPINKWATELELFQKKKSK